MDTQGGGVEAGGPGMDTWVSGMGSGVVEVEVGDKGKEEKGPRVEVSRAVGSILRVTQSPEKHVDAGGPDMWRGP